MNGIHYLFRKWTQSHISLSLQNKLSHILQYKQAGSFGFNLFNFIYLSPTTTSSGKFLKRQEYQTTWPASWEITMQFRKQQLELDMNQHTGSK